MKVYLDNCCYNRPYDDQTYINVSLETQAKLFIQNLVRQKKILLVTSYILDYENGKNPFVGRMMAIADFMKNFSSDFVPPEINDEITNRAAEIQKTGIHVADSYHIACAEYAKCDYFITTDYRVLKFNSQIVKIMNPIDFVRILGDEHE